MFDTSPGFGGDAFGGASLGTELEESASTGTFAAAAAAGGGSTADIFAALSPEQSQRFAREFQQIRGPDGFVPGDTGRRLLERKGIVGEVLEKVWRLSDLDRDGRLSLREFVCALHLAEQTRSGRPLPMEVTVAQQTTLVRSVRGDDAFSTADTAASLGMARRRAGGNDDFDSADFSSAAASRLAGGLFNTHAGDGNDPVGSGGLLLSGEGGAMGLDTSESLGQLAAVFDVVARLDAGGELKRLCHEVMEERAELERQLSRRRDFERQLKEAHASLDGFRDERRQVEKETAMTQRRISHLQDELAFAESEVQQTEQSLAMLRDATGTGAAVTSSRGPTPYLNAEEERRDVVGKVRVERDLLRRDQAVIEETRMKLETVLRQKVDAQASQQALLEKQRQTEQDRGLMLTAIEGERGKLSAMRAERLRLWEDRSVLEKEMADLAQQEWLASGRPKSGAIGAPAAAAALPTAASFSSAPTLGAAAQRNPRQQKGVPNDEQQPAVIYGSVPNHFPDADTRPQARADRRGVRNT